MPLASRVGSVLLCCCASLRKRALSQNKQTPAEHTVLCSIAAALETVLQRVCCTLATQYARDVPRLDSTGSPMCRPAATLGLPSGAPKCRLVCLPHSEGRPLSRLPPLAPFGCLAAWLFAARRQAVTRERLALIARPPCSPITVSGWLLAAPTGSRSQRKRVAFRVARGANNWQRALSSGSAAGRQLFSRAPTSKGQTMRPTSATLAPQRLELAQR